MAILTDQEKEDREQLVLSAMSRVPQTMPELQEQIALTPAQVRRTVLRLLVARRLRLQYTPYHNKLYSIR